MKMSIKFFEKANESHSALYGFFDKINFSDLQNVIMGLIAFLVPLLIYFFGEYNQTEQSKLFLKQIINKLKGKKVILFIFSSLLLLSINFTNIYLKLIILIIFIITSCLLISLYNYTFKSIFNGKIEMLIALLKDEKIEDEDKIDVWEKSVWNKVWEKEEEKKLGNIFLNQLSGLFKKLIENKSKSILDTDHQNFKNLLYSYTHNDIEFLDMVKEDIVEDKKHYRMVNFFYSDQLFKWTTESYLENKDNLISYILSRAFERILVVTLNKGDFVVYQIFEDSFLALSPDDSDMDDSKKKKGSLLSLVFSSLFAVADLKKLKNILYSSSGVILEEIELNNSLSMIAFLNEFQSIEEDRKKVLIENIFDGYNKRYLHMAFAFLHHGFEMPTEKISFLYDFQGYVSSTNTDGLALKIKKGEEKSKKTFMFLENVFLYYSNGIKNKLYQAKKKELYDKDGENITFKKNWFIGSVNYFLEETKSKDTGYSREYQEFFKAFSKYLLSKNIIEKTPK